MAAFNLSPIGNGWQFFGGNTGASSPNIPLAGGQLQTYAAGTNTPTVTYSNNLGSISNPTTIILDSTGRTPNEIWFPNGQAYKFILADSVGATIATYDNLVGVNDTSTIGGLGLSEWLASGFVPTYSSATVFTTTGNSTGVFQPGRRIQAIVTAGTIYGYVLNSVFAAGSTTVTVSTDTGTVLDNGLSTVNVSLLSATNSSIPGTRGTIFSVYKAADTDRASTTTVTDDPDLHFTVFSPGYYAIRLCIYHSGVGSTTNGLKFSLASTATTNPSNPLTSFVLYGITNNAALGPLKYFINTTSSLTPIINSTTPSDPFFIDGRIIFTSTGVFSFKWAQVASDVNPTRLGAGSFFQLERLS